MGSLSAFMRDVFSVFVFLVLMLLGMEFNSAAKYYVPKSIDEGNQFIDMITTGIIALHETVFILMNILMDCLIYIIIL